MQQCCFRSLFHFHRKYLVILKQWPLNGFWWFTNVRVAKPLWSDWLNKLNFWLWSAFMMQHSFSASVASRTYRRSLCYYEVPLPVHRFKPSQITSTLFAKTNIAFKHLNGLNRLPQSPISSLSNSHTHTHTHKKTFLHIPPQKKKRNEASGEAIQEDIPPPWMACCVAEVFGKRHLQKKGAENCNSL